uniref:3',5'-cyclic-GMP phosphodiesterase n=1 Tax=Dendroctonus ponderosae TaxID=77166 RepID=A0AAR5Q408_DENPD
MAQQGSDPRSSEAGKQQDFKVQIVVTPVDGRDGSAEIRIMGGTASRKWSLRRNSTQLDSLRPSAKATPLTTNQMASEEQVAEYLAAHPDFLEKFVIAQVDIEQLERWIIRKSQQLKKRPEVGLRNSRKTSLSRWKFCVHADKRQMLQDLTQSLQLKPTKSQVLWELSSCISSAVNADGFRLYTIEKSSDSDELHLFLVLDSPSEGGQLKFQRIRNGINVALHVAHTQVPVRLTKGQPDARFGPETSAESESAHMQCQPIIQPNGEAVAVLELWRGTAGGPFHEEDEEIAASYLVWGGIALHYAHLYLNMNQQKQLNDFLLAVVKSIFQDMVSMDMLVMKIMNFAQRLVNADRASLFLVDSKNKELYATIFDIGIDECTDKLCRENEGDDLMKVHTSKEIRFPLGTGIAGQVAMTGNILNIKDAYADDRFNRTVDQLTGYTTKTILCMPIYIRGSIIGVVQMVNKQAGFFTSDDEAAFETFAVYCGLALHHAKLYDKIKKSEQKYKVALEVLSYHNTCTEEEFQGALSEGIPEHIPGVDDYYFNPFQIPDRDKAIHSIYMFIDLFGLARFEVGSLIKFVLTVRKNYRTIRATEFEGHNIFNKLSSSDYKQVLGLLKHCILATDLAVFFPNKARLTKIVEEGAFSWSNTEHRLLLQAISMTGSDLSASAKPWGIQVETVRVIFEEFYQQGDAERKAGRHPIPMMDRAQPDEQPSSQVGFLTGICLPCYNLLNALIPDCKPLLDMCQSNLDHWRQIDEDIKERREQP